MFDTVAGEDGEPLRYTHVAGCGILHSGTLPHHVEPLVSGQRENIIIWVTCSPSGTLAAKGR